MLRDTLFLASYLVEAWPRHFTFSETAARPDGVNSTTRTRPLLRISSLMLQLVYVSTIFTRYRCRAYLPDTGALANQTSNKQAHSLSMVPCADWQRYARRIASPRVTVPRFSHNLHVYYAFSRYRDNAAQAGLTTTCHFLLHYSEIDHHHKLLTWELLIWTLYLTIASESRCGSPSSRRPPVDAWFCFANSSAPHLAIAKCWTRELFKSNGTRARDTPNLL